MFHRKIAINNIALDVSDGFVQLSLIEVNIHVPDGHFEAFSFKIKFNLISNLD